MGIVYGCGWTEPSTFHVGPRGWVPWGPWTALVEPGPAAHFWPILFVLACFHEFLYDKFLDRLIRFHPRLVLT